MPKRCTLLDAQEDDEEWAPLDDSALAISAEVATQPTEPLSPQQQQQPEMVPEAPPPSSAVSEQGSIVAAAEESVASGGQEASVAATPSAPQASC